VVIYKYPFAVEDVQHVVMPPGAKLLTVGVQDERPVLWADVQDDGEYTGRQIAVVMTGGCPPDEASYVGTFMLAAGRFVGRFVGHVYDLGEQTLEERERS
jgi:hypothetical protein